MDTTTLNIINNFDNKFEELLSSLNRNYASQVTKQYNKMEGIKNKGAAKSRVNQSYKTELVLLFLEAFSQETKINLSYTVALTISEKICSTVSKATLANLFVYKFSKKKTGRNAAKDELELVEKYTQDLAQVYERALDKLKLTFKLMNNEKTNQHETVRKVRKI